MKEDLQRLKDALERKVPKLRQQYFCSVSPTSINLGLQPERRNELLFYGYNLDAGTVIVTIIDNRGSTRDVPNSPLLIATPTHYLMTLNLSEVNGIRLTSTDQQIRFSFSAGAPDGTPPAVNILAAPDPRFSVTEETQTVNGDGGIICPRISRTCPAGSIGVGIQGRSGEFVDQIQLVCSPLNPDGSLGNQQALAADGGPGGDPYTQLCPDNQVLVGFFGRSSGNLENIGGQCRRPDVVVGQTGFVVRIGPNGGNGGSPLSEDVHRATR